MLLFKYKAGMAGSYSALVSFIPAPHQELFRMNDEQIDYLARFNKKKGYTIHEAAALIFSVDVASAVDDLGLPRSVAAQCINSVISYGNGFGFKPNMMALFDH